MALERKKRMQDGSFGEAQKIGKGETDAEKIQRLETEKQQLREDMNKAIMELTMLITTTSGGNA